VVVELQNLASGLHSESDRKGTSTPSASPYSQQVQAMTNQQIDLIALSQKARKRKAGLWKKPTSDGS
jgi:hypothetical protein